MAIPVKLEVFEGPLDLLLHLIEKNKVDIYDIPIVLITTQYMNYIKEMKANNLEVMSEFLVMAATLLKIKSNMLLPKEEKDIIQEDPRQELIERLLEYKMYKYMSLELKDRQIDAAKAFYKKPMIPKELLELKQEVNTEELLEGLTLKKLHEIFKSVIKKQVDKVDPIRSKFGKIEKEEINLTEKMSYIEQFAKIHKQFRFRDMLEGQNGKMEIIVTFLGILEMMKTGKIEILQEHLFDDIFISYKGAI